MLANVGSYAIRSAPVLLLAILAYSLSRKAANLDDEKRGSMRYE